MKRFPAIYCRINPPKWAANEYKTWGVIGFHGARASTPVNRSSNKRRIRYVTWSRVVLSMRESIIVQRWWHVDPKVFQHSVSIPPLTPMRYVIYFRFCDRANGEYQYQYRQFRQVAAPGRSLPSPTAVLVYAVVTCLSVCPSVTSWHCTKTAKRIGSRYQHLAVYQKQRKIETYTVVAMKH